MSMIYNAYSHLCERNCIYMVYCWFQIWAALAYLSYFLPFKFGYEKYVRDIICKIPTILHGLVILTACYLYLYFEGFEFGAANTQFQRFIFEVSFGYYIADVALMFMLWKLNIEIIVHHVIVTVGFAASFITGYGGHEIMAFFVIGRIFAGSFVVYNMNLVEKYIKSNCNPTVDCNTAENCCEIDNNCPLFVKISGTAVLVLSIYFAAKMPKKIFSKIEKRRLEAKKKV